MHFSSNRTGCICPAMDFDLLATEPPTTTGRTPEEVLHKVFGYESFRPLQGEAVRELVNGGDVLVLMPTGGGKS
ncbi:MAG TPA: ATP-dependent DNA helicase RecQ, partial [Marinobacter sp.]|nr:ATP-dependent DNA helicase RecQ [Marinobacter sp.]